MKLTTQSIIVLSLLLFCSIVGYSQDIQKENVKINYIHLPENPLPSTIKSYSKKITLPKSFYDGSKKEYVEKRLNEVTSIAGFKEDPTALHFHIEVEVHNFKHHEFKEKISEKIKVIEGKQMKFNYYNYELSYKMPVFFQVIIQGKKIRSGYLKNSNHYVSVSTPLLRSAAEREIWKKEYSEDFINTLRKKEFERHCNEIQDFLETNYAYRTITTYAPILHLESTKKRNYTDYNTICKEMKAALELIEAKKGHSGADFDFKAKQVIAQFKTLLKNVDFNDKKALYNREVSAYIVTNIGMLSYWLNDFNTSYECLKYAQVHQVKDVNIEEYKSKIKSRNEKLEKFRASIIQ
ncbi:hypothetical protein [Flammeovirga pacifica]|uniref:Uncharacterized protein n=1 Tax=Flammeovirga pacifica TaxID=915059 RepID=A0A1S1YZK4_FLAPC|nr:hypothetical protein [Flammeovirga pacifica]OHX66430.1 hypothetical protein NH26_08700 [Flammeovirga pacifica]